MMLFMVMLNLIYNYTDTPTDINCIMNNSADGCIAINVSWYLPNNAITAVESLDLSCNCSLLGTFTKRVSSYVYSYAL